MNIKTRLKTVSWLAAVIALLVMLIFAWTREQLNQAMVRHDLAEQMLSTAYKRSTVRSEYFLNSDERPKEQWIQLTDTLSKLIKQAQAISASPEQALLLKKIAPYPGKTQTFFAHLLENRRDMAEGRTSDAFAQEIERRITAQLVIDSQSLLTQLLKFQELTDQEYVTWQSRNNIFVLISLLALTCFTIASLTMLARSIAIPLKKLREGIEIISTGNLDYRIDVRGNDELSNLALASNDMAAKLKAITVSRDELDKETTFSRTALDSLPGLFYLFDQNGSFLRWNHNFEKVSGYSAEEIGRMPPLAIFGEAEKSLVAERIRQVFETGEASVEAELLSKDKSRTPCLFTGKRFIFEGKTCLIGMGIDITDRIRAEEALRLAHDRLRLFVDANIVGIVVASPAGGIIEANDYYLRMIGYTREEFNQGMVDWRSITPPEWLTADEKAIHELREHGICTPYEKEYVRRDGARVPVLLADAMLPGAEEQIAAFALDISERKKAEAEVLKLNDELELRVAERTAQLEAANKELEAFSYSVSHDLRAPLRAVDGYTRMLLEDYESHFDAEGKRICSVISESARDMGKLIDDLLAFSRVGRTTLQPSAVDMAGMAQSIYFEITTPESRERIDFNVVPLPPGVGDPTLLRQVWMNLLLNAVKFSSKKECSLIEVSAGQQGDEIVYSVRDNGAGFDMRYMDKLFGVFQRLHSTKEFEGTGVGLAIVKRIIARHGGRIWGEGVIGKGATFYFTLGNSEEAWTNRR